MRINHNIAALNTHRQLTGNTNNVQKSLEKLSSGLRINRAGDDAAGLAISEKMRGQIRGLEMAQKNSQDGISLIQTAEGALTETHAILQRMRELVVQAGNTGTQEPDDLQAIQDEIVALTSEIDGIAERTEFNGKSLINGNITANADENGVPDEDAVGLVFQIGANTQQTLSVNIESMKSADIIQGTDGTALTIDVTNFVSDPVEEEVDGDGNVTTPGVPAAHQSDEIGRASCRERV